MLDLCTERFAPKHGVTSVTGMAEIRCTCDLWNVLGDEDRIAAISVA